jgi:hypothetical protein
MEAEAKRIEDFSEQNLKVPIDFSTQNEVPEKIENHMQIESIKYKRKEKKIKTVEVDLKLKPSNNLF